MRKTIRNVVAESVKDLINGGFLTSFTNKELKDLGIKIPEVLIAPEKVRSIRKKTRFSQTVFARLLNVSPSSVRQWEQGKRRPTGSTKVLLDILDKNSNHLKFPVLCNLRSQGRGQVMQSAEVRMVFFYPWIEAECPSQSVSFKFLRTLPDLQH
jgi:putative transcriptional regulator